jgi:hypothetical protein
MFEKGAFGFGEEGKHQNNRKLVKEGIVRAYSLHKAAKTLEAMLLEPRISSNPIIATSFQLTIDSYNREIKDILETPSHHFGIGEIGLMEFVKYQIQHDERDVTKVADVKINRWLQRRRQCCSAYLDGNRNKLKGAGLEVVMDNVRLLEQHLHVKFCLFKTHDDYMAELQEFKAKNGHVKVPRLQEGANLGESWTSPPTVHVLLDN